jgi:cellulose synthase/poly-beta-1,6-N-acetylglucosamine synthase-like glycosyltransferase
LLDSVIAVDYPRDRLEIIVVDDSDDGTTEVLRSYEERHPGLVTLIHRERREGFKAGALQTALLRSRSEFVAIFDADQIPAPDFLRCMIPYLCFNKTIAFAQARPIYLHDGKSWVARALSLGMDAYAFVEQEARFSADLLTHFSGGGGIFRRSAIMDVGGWNSETLAEDLDLSIRLRLSGWRHVYDMTVACPSEAPTSFQVLRQQQFRWASGFAGCLKKHFGSLVATRQMSVMQKAEAVVYLTGYAASPLIAVGVLLAVLYCLVFPPNFIESGFMHNALAAFTVLMSALIYTAPLALFAVAVFRSTDAWSRRVMRVVDLAYLGILSVSIFLTSARAVLDGLLNRATYFYRTPKRGELAQSKANV